MIPGVGLQQEFVKILTDPFLQQELRRGLDWGCDVLLSAISRQLSPTAVCEQIKPSFIGLVLAF